MDETDLLWSKAIFLVTRRYVLRVREGKLGLDVLHGSTAVSRLGPRQ